MGRPESPHDRSTRAPVPQPRRGMWLVDHTNDDYTPAEESRPRTNVFALPLQSQNFNALPTPTWGPTRFSITDSTSPNHQGTARPQSSQQVEISALSAALNQSDPTPTNQAVDYRQANSEHETQPGTEANSSSSSSPNSSTTTTTTTATAAVPRRRAPSTSTFPYSNTRHGYPPGTLIVRRLGNEACPSLVTNAECESQECPYSHDPRIVEPFRQVRARYRGISSPFVQTP